MPTPWAYAVRSGVGRKWWATVVERANPADWDLDALAGAPDVDWDLPDRTLWHAAWTILVAAAGPDIPAPLVDQLADGGRLVLPLDTGEEQQLVRVRKNPGGPTTEVIGPANFVPLLGQIGRAHV